MTNRASDLLRTFLGSILETEYPRNIQGVEQFLPRVGKLGIEGGENELLGSVEDRVHLRDKGRVRV